MSDNVVPFVKTGETIRQRRMRIRKALGTLPTKDTLRQTLDAEYQMEMVLDLADAVHLASMPNIVDDRTQLLVPNPDQLTREQLAAAKIALDTRLKLLNKILPDLKPEEAASGHHDGMTEGGRPTSMPDAEAVNLIRLKLQHLHNHNLLEAPAIEEEGEPDWMT